MGYKNNQFFDNGQGETANRVAIPAKNGPFGSGVVGTYPDNTLRISNFDETGKWIPADYKLSRGYIRTLTDYGTTSDTSGTDIKLLKCNFQFNPDKIVHSVPMRTTLTNMALQSPTQMSQPVGGEVSFAFDLMFDRSYTLNNQVDNNNINEDLLGTSAEKNIGVLEDLRALYAVIGQGLSKEMIDFQKYMMMQQGTAQVEAGLDNIDENDKRTPDWDKFFDNNVNFGNSAFLVPVPVRVLFSSLFMVDGYVTSTEVVYTKFSRTMVPMQCAVNVQMNAMYVGFAKQKTFLTVNLDAAEEEAKKSMAEKTSAAKDALVVIERNIKKLTVKTFTELLYEYTTFNSTGIYIQHRDLKSIEAIDLLLVPDSRVTTALAKRVGETSIAVNKNPDAKETYMEVDIEETNLYSDRPVNGTSDKDKIKAIFENQSPSIKMNVEWNIYGPFTSAEADNLVTWEKAIAKDQVVTAANRSTRDLLLKKKVVSIYLNQPDITTWEDWEIFRKGDKRVATKEMHNSSFSDSSLEALAKQSDGKYFVTIVSGSVTPKVSGYQASTLLFYTNAQKHRLEANSNDGDVKLDLEFKKKATD